jgi:hypothetical protein
MLNSVPALEGKPLVFTTADGRKRQIGIITVAKTNGAGIYIEGTVDDEVVKRVLKARSK